MTLWRRLCAWWRSRSPRCPVCGWVFLPDVFDPIGCKCSWLGSLPPDLCADIQARSRKDSSC